MSNDRIDIIVTNSRDEKTEERVSPLFSSLMKSSLILTKRNLCSQRVAIEPNSTFGRESPMILQSEEGGVVDAENDQA